MTRLIVAALLLLLAGCRTMPPNENPPVRTVSEVDLQRYLGTWHEIAHFPMFFQRHCIGDTTADYALRPDGDIRVTNRCRTESGFDQATGHAKVVDGSRNARLRVSFFWPFYGDYWIIGLDPDYRWAVVGSPSRKYLWVLARSNDLPDDQLEAALNSARSQGYDLTPLVLTGPAAARQGGVRSGFSRVMEATQ